MSFFGQEKHRQSIYFAFVLLRESCIKILDKESSQINIDDLGLNQVVLRNFKKSLNSSEGMILVTGPTGSGKTTTFMLV